MEPSGAGKAEEEVKKASTDEGGRRHGVAKDGKKKTAEHLEKAEHAALRGELHRSIKILLKGREKDPEDPLIKEAEALYTERLEGQLRLKDHLKELNLPYKNGRTFQLQNGRTLGYEIFGHGFDTKAILEAATDAATAETVSGAEQEAGAEQEQGKVLLFFHGTPGSRLFFTNKMIRQAKDHRVTVYVIERPGFGLSTHHKERTLVSFAEDVKEFITGLRLPKVAILGYSAGGPFAVACAKVFPELLHSVALVSCPSPPENPKHTEGMSTINFIGNFLARHSPFGIKLAVSSEASKAVKDPIHHLWGALTATKADAVAYLDHEIEMVFVTSAKEQYSHDDGINAEVLDYRLFSAPWGFNLGDLKEVRFHLWYGTDDLGVVPAMGRYLAAHLPNNEAVEMPGKGHLLFFEVWGDALAKSFS